MAQAGSWPVAGVDCEGTPDDWMHVQGLTIDKGLWYLVHWRSTVDKIVDVYPSGDTRRVFDTSGNLGNLWDQLKSFAENKIGAKPACDRFGRLFVQIDPNLLENEDRDGLPVVQAITKGDWRDQIQIAKRLPQTSLLETAGFGYVGGEWAPILSRAPGNTMNQIGSFKSRYNLVFSSQEQANSLTALIFAAENNPFPVVPISLACNQRLIDIAPQQYVTLSVAVEDTPRGLVWTNRRLIPRRVTYLHDGQSGAMLTDIECEAETFPGTAVTVIPPQSPVDNIPDQPGDFEPPDPIESGTDDPEDTIGRPPDDDTPTCYDPGAGFNGPYEMFTNHTMIEYIVDAEDGGTNTRIVIPFPCYIRAGSALNKSYIQIHGTMQYQNPDTYLWYPLDEYDFSLISVSAIDAQGNDLIFGSTTVLAGYPNMIKSTFSPASGMNVHGFRIRLTGPYVLRLYTEDPDGFIYNDNSMIDRDLTVQRPEDTGSGDYLYINPSGVILDIVKGIC